MDATEFWFLHQKELPALYSLYLICFNSPATSVACERVFKHAKAFCSNVRRRLNPKKYEEMLMIKKS